MPRTRSGRLAAALAVVAVALPGSTGCTTEAAEPTRLRIATGSATAVYYAVGQSLAGILNRELPDVTASVVVTAASAENVSLVRAGRAELGFTQADILATEPDQRVGLSAVARVYDDLLHLVTLSQQPIRRLTDLTGKRVAIGAPGSGTAVTAERLLDVAKVDDKLAETLRLGIDDSVAALRAGRIDAFFFSGGLPVKAVADFAAQTRARFVDLGQWVEPLRRSYREVYVQRDIPASAYGSAPVTTVAVPNYLVVATNLPEQLVYDVTRLLMQRRDELSSAHPAAARLNVQSAITTTPLALHPGAARYYQTHKP
ncbi:TAXI family TRAP transporter solute-binding subunit [Micromonospora sp. WMMD1102]|uniref:TAXI family TRAP transporter solute-binding subunit n=1 Tax=Micromonospora sp. WMMD1102 TaxID=3016105 RepID=UPI002414E6CE|nr:TAXI family TRAP transporter solute-binding subunit [Micromonospora sp. WMMD1102]MDG4790056.1 TAXI family TRAP transporter solute-binding subunit [Micromonospora sp. WMMD1102]